MQDIYNSKIAKMLAWLNKADTYAITISSTCTLYSVAEDKVSDNWRWHEGVHKDQIKRRGWWRFFPRYIYYLWKYSYKTSPFEIEGGMPQ